MFGPDFGKEPHELQVVIRYDVLTREFALEGCDKNAVVAAGMLEYAMSRVKRFLLQGDIERELQNAPRIQVSNRLVT